MCPDITTDEKQFPSIIILLI